jgi:hypothetical protein
MRESAGMMEEYHFCHYEGAKQDEATQNYK